MEKIKEFVIGLLENVLAEVVVAVGISLVGIVYALYTGNPQLILQIVLILLVVIDIVVSLLSLRRQKIIQSQVDKSSQELSRLQKWFPSTEYKEVKCAHKTGHQNEVS